MGCAASIDNKPRCPYHRLCEAEIRKAKTAHYIDGEASDFYFYCSNGDIDQVRKILEAPNRQPIDELVKLERNGDTALHVATEKEHVEIVKLLLEHKCSRIIRNRFGKVASEVATTPVMQKLFMRSEASDRFHGSDTSKTMAYYLPKDNGTDTTSNGTEATSNKTLEFIHPFETKKEVEEYSLNDQTMAMWLKFYSWFSRTFPSFFQRDNLNLDSFQLHKNTDFDYFLRQKLGEKYEETRKEFNAAAEAENSIDHLLTIYSDEDCGFYRSLNQQLANSPNEADTSPHLCDRFVIEFHLRGDELEKRSFTGTVYRGATIKSSEVLLYENVYKSKPPGVIVFKAFTSTTEDKNIALRFITRKLPKQHETGVLFVIKIKKKSPTIIGIANVSKYESEKEILIIPGNLFIVTEIVKDFVVDTKHGVSITLTKIHLEHLHKPVWFWKKLWHTYQAAKKNSVM